MIYLYNPKDELVVKLNHDDKKFFYWKHHTWLRSYNDLPLLHEYLIPDSAILLVGAPIYE